MTFLTTDHTSVPVTHKTAPQAKLSLFTRTIQRIGDSYMRAMQRRAEREYLSANLAHTVRDTGIDSATLKNEINKPFWRA